MKDLKEIMEQSKAKNQTLTVGNLYIVTGRIYQLTEVIKDDKVLSLKDSAIIELPYEKDDYPNIFVGNRIGKLQNLTNNREINLYEEDLIHTIKDSDIIAFLYTNSITDLVLKNGIRVSLGENSVTISDDGESFIYLDHLADLQSIIAFIKKEINI